MGAAPAAWRGPAPIGPSTADDVTDMRSPLVAVHVPKTAGTSFQVVLQELAGDGYRRYDGPPVEIDPDITCLHGHVPASVRLEQFPDAPLVAWLRHPVDRLLSHHRYWSECPDLNHPVCARMCDEGLGPVELAEAMPDVQLQMLDVDLDRFDFVGIVEQVDVSLQSLARLTGRPGLDMPWVNSTAPVPHDARDRQRLAALCADALELYRQGLAHLLATMRGERSTGRLREWANALTPSSARR